MIARMNSGILPAAQLDELGRGKGRAQDLSNNCRGEREPPPAGSKGYRSTSVLGPHTNNRRNTNRKTTIPLRSIQNTTTC
jgi:hypothetical protein